MSGHPPQEQISAWIDGQLEGEEADQLSLHLQQCESCRQVQWELTLTTQLYRDLEAPEAPAYLWTRVAAELPPQERRERFAWSKWRGEWPLISSVRLAAVVLGLLVVVGTAVVMFHRQSMPPAEMAVLTQIDAVHASLTARNAEFYNPFHTSARLSADSNPFTRSRVEADSNPFESMRGRR